MNESGISENMDSLQIFRDGVERDREEKPMSTTLRKNQTINPNLVSLETFMRMDIPPRESLLSPIIFQQNLGMIHAYRGIGKTYLIMGIAYALATGGSILGWKAEKPRGVLLLDGEMPAPVLQERFSSIIAASDKELKAPFKIMTPDLQSMEQPPLNLAFPEDQESLECRLDGIEVIIVDNLSTLCRTQKTNDSDSWQPIQTWALRQRAMGRSVLFVHHSGKSGLQRGTSAKEDILDFVIGLKRPSDYEENQGARFELYFEKARGITGKDADPIEAQMTIDHQGRMVWTYRPLEESIYEIIIELAKEGMSHREIGEEVGKSKTRITRILQKARAEGKL